MARTKLMIVFIDESGDSGLKIEQGSSRFFTVSLVVFEDNDDALACDQRIDLLKHELGYQPGYEFHFKNNSDRVREAFLKAVAPYNFFYYGIVINKNPELLYGPGFKHKESFYKYACSLVFENAKDKLVNARVKIDGSGDTVFRRQLSKYLKSKMNDGTRAFIKNIKTERSSSNNLIQLADYVAGVINRSVQGKKKNSMALKQIIAHREIYIQIWPK